MKFELQFNEAIYRKQMELLYEMGFGRKKTYLKNSNYMGFTFVILGIITIIGKGKIGYIFFVWGLFMLISYYRFYFKQKKFKQKYEAEQVEIIKSFTENPKVTFEFNDESMTYSDYKGTTTIRWNEFLKYIIKEENVFLITKKFQPFVFGKTEVGNENYFQILNLIESKIVSKTIY